MRRATTTIAAVAWLASFAIAREQEQQQYGAIEYSPADLVPRFFIHAPRLVQRDGSPCEPGQHRCVDIGEDGICCPNDQYCYIKPNGDPHCCPVGSNCDSACPATAYQCGPSSSSASGASGTTSASSGSGSDLATAASSCCDRICQTTSSFRCEEEFGGGCCPYGATCASDGACVSTRTSSASESALVTPLDPGCTATYQFACPSEEGCCDRGLECTSLDGEPVCARGATATAESGGTDDNDDDDDGSGGGGLSAGARAGIGVGVAAAVSALIGILAWFCLVRRKKQQQQKQRNSQGGAGVVAAAGGASGSGSGSNPSRSRPGARRNRTISELSPGHAPSDVTTEVSRPGRRRGLTQDYFGPDAVPGPYTEHPDSTGTSPGQDRGVPLQAHSPNDITAPVEIDSNMSPTDVGKSGMTPVVMHSRPSPPVMRESMEGRHELYGSVMAGSPRGQQQQQGGQYFPYQYHLQQGGQGSPSPIPSPRSELSGSERGDQQPRNS